MTDHNLQPIAKVLIPRFLAVLCLLGSMISVASAQSPYAYARSRYQLVERNGVITADVFFRGGQMIVNDANGTQYVFFRDRQFDSIDRAYVGYLLPGVNRVVQFPRSGSGMMLVADLDDVYPHFEFSRRSVHRAGPNNTPFVPPSFVSPYIGPPFTAPVFAGPAVGGFGFAPSLGYGAPLGIPGHPFLRPGWFPRPMQSITLDSQIVPRAPLPPVTLRLANQAQREMRVTVNDLQNPTQPKQVRIAPGAAREMQFERDAGADHIRRVRTFAPDGSVITRDLSTPVPPAPRYELVVHEWRLQSVAIDRTGKSPNFIEDTNFQGRGLGRFLLPPGDQLRSGTIDVVRTALEARNAGSVAPLLDDSGRTTNTPRGTRAVSPLEQMLIEQQKARGGG
ncbi:MAG: hypothetical protein AAFX06_22385 [Planctomycetota bacterium]